MTDLHPVDPGVGPDLLRGADQIATFLFGDSRERRKIYHLAEHAGLPIFRLGAVVCARRSTILSWIEAQESAQAAKTEPR
jgi:hypothetical protein